MYTKLLFMYGLDGAFTFEFKRQTTYTYQTNQVNIYPFVTETILPGFLLKIATVPSARAIRTFPLT